MNRVALSIPELALIAGTRAALGAGLGLLVADRLSDDQRRAVGWTLLGIGVVTTIPIAVQLFNAKNEGRIGDVGSAAPPGGFARAGGTIRALAARPSIRVVANS